MSSSYWDVDECGWVSCPEPTGATAGPQAGKPEAHGSVDERPAPPQP